MSSKPGKLCRSTSSAILLLGFLVHRSEAGVLACKSTNESRPAQHDQKIVTVPSVAQRILGGVRFRWGRSFVYNVRAFCEN